MRKITLKKTPWIEVRGPSGRKKLGEIKLNKILSDRSQWDPLPINVHSFLKYEMKVVVSRLDET